MKVQKTIIMLSGIMAILVGCNFSDIPKGIKHPDNFYQHKDAITDLDDTKGYDAIKDVKNKKDSINTDEGQPDTWNSDALVCPKKPVSNNPNAWKDDQVCLKWKRIKTKPSECMGFGMGYDTSINGCNCSKPPYCWCVYREGSVLIACSPDNKLCCKFYSSCIPCDWHVLTYEIGPEYKKNPPECENIVNKVEYIDPNTEYRACYEWKK